MTQDHFLRQVLLSLTLVLALAGLSRAMTLPEAVEYAMENNRDLLMLRQSVTERQGMVLEARAEALPVVNLNGSAFRVRDPGFLNSTFGQELLKGGGIDNGEGPPIPLAAIMPKPQTFYDLAMTVNQPLFTWGKVTSAIKLARLGTREIDLRVEALRRDIAYQVTGAYYDLLLAEDAVAMYDKSLETQRRYLRQTRDYFEVGDATRLDVLRAESQLASTEPDLVQARNERDQARKRLNFLLGRPLDEPVEAGQTSVLEDYQPPALDSVITTAIAERPDLKQLDIQVRMYEETIDVREADFRPSVDLAGSFGYSTIRTDNIFDRNFESWRIAVQFTVPIFDGFRNRGVVMQTQALKDQKQIEADKLAEQIVLDARQSRDATATAVQVYQARKVSLESAEEEERVTSDQHEQGLVTLFELLESNRRTIEARNDYLRARYDMMLQIAALKRVMGTPVSRLFEL